MLHFHTQCKLELWVKSLSNTNNYLPWIISLFGPGDHPTWCTSSGGTCKLQLCIVSTVSLHALSRSCAYKKYGQTDRRKDRLITIIIPPTLFCTRYNKVNVCFTCFSIFKFCYRLWGGGYHKCYSLHNKEEINHHPSK